MANRLASSLSPYLAQHADNPVNWYPWGAEAFELARREGKPIFLSIGYSACHWCHVMEKESFRNPRIAALLNEHFVAVKVDREERPDVDQTYCEAVQALCGHAGWPLSVFLTPDLEPFYGGTYWPPRRWGGMPGFDEVLLAVVDAWKNRREQVHGLAQQIRVALEKANCRTFDGSLGDQSLVGKVAELLHERFDPQNGGFGQAPKFPHPLELRLLIRHWLLTGEPASRLAVETTLRSMARGGIHDQLGGGFHRYSVDAAWLIPHFEKMLYDNAMLALTYLEAWQVWNEPWTQAVTCRTLDYMLRDLALPGGGFAASEDADSEGEEGKFYLWTAGELADVVGQEEASLLLFALTSPAAQVDGKYVLHQARPAEEIAAAFGLSADGVERLVDGMCRKLFEARQKRARPSRDEKVLVSWNALAVEALACAGAAFGERKYLEAAERCLSFIRDQLWQEGKLFRVWRDGRRGECGFLEDYAALAWALTRTYLVTGNVDYLLWARELAERMITEFADRDGDGFFSTPAGVEAPLFRRKDVLDSPTPSGNGLAAMTLLCLGTIFDRSDYRSWAEKAIRACFAYLDVAPLACTQAVLAHELLAAGTDELVLVGNPAEPTVQEAWRKIQRHLLPRALTIFLPRSGGGEVVPGACVADWLAAQGAEACRLADAKTPVLFVCREHVCRAPVIGSEGISQFVDNWLRKP